MRSQQWFQRRRVGFGWRPADWRGWVVTLLAVAATIAVLILLRGSSARIPVMILIVAAYVVVALATGGTRPAEEAPAADEPTGGEAITSVGVVEQRLALRTLTSGRASTSSPDEPALLVEHLAKQ